MIMKNKEEIRKIITEHFKITTPESYKKWLVDWRANGGIVSDEDLKILSPDNINCRDFWIVGEELFGTDCVCNTLDGIPNVTEQMQGNRVNLNLAKQSGILNVIDHFSNYKIKILEIGAGYGSLKNYIEVKTEFDYSGFDVYPKIAGVLSTTDAGYIPYDYIVNNCGSFVIVASSNVFQHLSETQRKKYIYDSAELLSDKGYFLFNLMVDFGYSGTRKYMALYGQFCPVPSMLEIQDSLKERFIIQTTTTRYDGLVGFVCIKR